MKNLFKKVSVIFILLFSFVTTSSLVSPVPKVFADGDEDTLGGCRYLLGLVSWDCGITPNPKLQDEVISNVIVIASNILTDLLVASAYIVLFYTIYGGYLYIFANGNPNKTASGKKTLINAFIGLAVVLLANVGLNTVRIVLIGEDAQLDRCMTQDCANPDELIVEAINFALGIAGAIAAAYIVIAGINFITASGDANKINAARTTIIYACIGLAIIALARLITAFVTNIIKDAKQTSNLDNTTLIIAKENYYDYKH